MKRAPLSALVRPLVLVGVVVASACGVPEAPVTNTHAASTATPATPTSLRHGKVSLSEGGRALMERAGRATRRPATLGHDIFGPVYDETYSGGAVVSNAHVVLVHWADVSDATNVVNSSLVADLPGFYSAIIAGPYFAWLAEYNTTNPINPSEDPFGVSGTGQTIGYGTLDTSGTDTGGAYLITPTINTTKSLDDGFGGGDVGNEIVYQIGKGYLPAPELDALGYCNTVYVVDFPPTFNLDADGGSFCSFFCAVHASVGYGSSFLTVPYTMHPDLSSCSGCTSKTTYLEAEQFNHSHELVEAITDPGPDPGGLAWYDLSVSDGEIADLCATEPGVMVSGYYVTSAWSNANGECIGQAPLCAPGTPSPPSCTPCTTSGAPSCGTPTPVCDTTSGLCEGCLTDADCSNPSPICDKVSLTCRACKSGDCSGPTPICSTGGFTAGQCVQCDGPGQCKGATPVCYAFKAICVGCVLNTDCSGTTPICDTGTQTCRACTSSSDCSPDVCDTSSGACVGCLKSSDCGSETCDTTTHTCQCTGNSDCKNPTPVCGSGKTCEGCKSEGDCSGNPAGSACSGGSCVECTSDANCSAPTPVCNKKTNKCVAGSGADSGTDSGGPTTDSGVKKADSGSDGGTTTGSSGGCAMAPHAPDPGPNGVPVLVVAGLAILGSRRRSRDRRV